MRNKIMVFILLGFIIGSGLKAQNNASNEFLSVGIVKMSSPLIPDGSSTISVSDDSAYESRYVYSYYNLLKFGEAEHASVLSGYHYSNGKCYDGSGNVVPLYNCYYYTMEIDLGLTECMASNAICYYDQNWNLVDAYPVQCRPWCMN